MKIKYVLNDGSTVDAEKECECVTHSEPCWLHMNKLWKERNKSLGDTFAKIQAEGERLNELSYEFKKRNILKILYINEGEE